MKQSIEFKLKPLVRCQVCGKLSQGRLPKGGDGTFLFPRRYSIDGVLCKGNYEEAVLDEKTGKMTIQEGNILIGEFLGYEYHPEDSINDYKGVLRYEGEWSDLLVNDPPYPGQHNWTTNWHRSWNSLMEVVEKIESIKDDHHGYFAVLIRANNCIIQGTNWHKYVQQEGYGDVYYTDDYGHTKIEATWTAVVNFIVWRNSLKSEK